MNRDEIDALAESYERDDDIDNTFNNIPDTLLYSGSEENSFVNEKSYADEEDLQSLSKLFQMNRGLNVDTVHDHLSELHELKIENKSLSLQLEHSELRCISLQNKEKAFRNEVDRFNHILAQTEQDKLLLTEKLRQVGSFENKNSKERDEEGAEYLDSIVILRGQLLDASNARVQQLEETLSKLKHEYSEALKSATSDLNKSRADNIALREEVSDLCGQLAERTVLYSAQERRWRESNRAVCNNSNPIRKPEDPPHPDALFLFSSGEQQP